MLILTRHVGETVRIGDDIMVVVLGSKGHQVRLGIEAPKSVSVHRQEIYDQIQRDRREAQGDMRRQRDNADSAPALKESRSVSGSGSNSE